MENKNEILTEKVQQELAEYEDLVAINFNFMKSIGIEDPSQLLTVTPELFLLPNEIVKSKLEKIDVSIINEDPKMILELL